MVIKLVQVHLTVVLLDLIPNPGDTNLDDSVNVQDIVVLLNFILGFDEPSQQQFVNGDMNDDQVLNVLDVIRIVNNILGLAIEILVLIKMILVL